MRASRSLFALIPAVLVLSAPLSAHANLDLAKKNACMACHAVDKKLVGPSYQDVAKKYGDALAAVDALAASIKTLAAWVLGGAK
jgi:cytochrome c